MRQYDDYFAEIGDTSGCHRKALYSLLERAADRGQIPPVMIPALLPKDAGARERMADWIAGGRRAETAVDKWEHVARAKTTAGLAA